MPACAWCSPTRQDGRHHRPDAMRGTRARARRPARAASDPATGRAPSRTCTCSRRSCISPSPSSLPTIGSARASVFDNPSEPKDGRFNVPTAPGLGMVFDEAEMKRRSIPVAGHEAPQRTGRMRMTLDQKAFLAQGSAAGAVATLGHRPALAQDAPISIAARGPRADGPQPAAERPHGRRQLGDPRRFSTRW